MKIKPEKILKLIGEIDLIITAIKDQELMSSEKLESICPDHSKSARNLIHYTTIRSFDIRSIQRRLGNLGLSRLARAEAHILASLLNTKFILHKLLGNVGSESGKSGLSIKRGEKILTKHTKALLGYRSKGRRVRIMVTQPTEAAYNYQMVDDMVANGMNCARINCAHDNTIVWKKIIDNVKKASQKHKRKIKITMDLAGPKIRTGSMVAGPKIRKFSPRRNDYGKVVNPAQVVFVPSIEEDSPPDYIQVPQTWIDKLQTGDKITLKDTREKQRTLEVKESADNHVLLTSTDTIYIGVESVLNPERDDLEPIKAGIYSSIEQVIILRVGDQITIHKNPDQGEPALMDENGNVIKKSHISCSLPELINMVKEGEKVFFDDGKIGGIIKEIYPDRFTVSITHAKKTGSKLKADKGINLPHSELNVSGLTEKDKRDLKFIVENADVINFSFVNTPEDVVELLEELDRLNTRDKVGIILKIETIKAYNNLQEIILAAMQTSHIGVMIARGDLAIETGWENIGRIQEDMLDLCNAAHIPVIWATQVLENLAKKGLPSRSEITDTLTALQAECVMLNKGEYINEAITLLGNILSGMESYQAKNAPMLPELEKLERTIP